MSDFTYITDNTAPTTPADFAVALSYPSLNRYSNILANDTTRVKLRFDHYINANYILNGRMIAAQAPLPNTVEDFLEMLVLNAVPVVVMLTKTEERDVSKAAPYWGYLPEGGRATFGDYTVTTLDTLYPDAYEHSYPHDLQVRYLRVTRADQPPFDFLQVHFLGWPDFGVPENEQNLVDLVLLQFILTSCAMFAGRTRVVAHCSAGVGRTGVYAVLERIMEVVVFHTLELPEPSTILRLPRASDPQPGRRSSASASSRTRSSSLSPTRRP